MESNCCCLDAKVGLYEFIVLSTLLYRAETWSITLAYGRGLEAAHHRWLRIFVSHRSIKFQIK